ncbi:MAG TPA: acetyltransferase [Thermoanaerobaculia bacterium]|nr:acetyltransferase [Thermoanaerobaculia bacterium]
MNPHAIVFGLGDFARVLAFHLPYDVYAFVVDEAYRTTDSFFGKPVLAWDDAPKEHPFFAAVGYSNGNRNRQAIFERAKAAGFAQPGLGGVNEGTIVLPHAIIEPFARIGVNCVLWSGCHVAHDTVIEDHVFLAPQAAIAGNCRIGERTFVGVNATVRDGVTIGADCVIGAGAVVVRDVKAGSVVKG